MFVNTIRSAARKYRANSPIASPQFFGGLMRSANRVSIERDLMRQLDELVERFVLG